MTALLVRPSTDDDIPTITRIYAHHVLHGLASFEEVPPDAAELAARRRDVLRHGLPHLVADDEGEVTGYCYAAPYRARSAYRFTIEDSVYIDAAHTGHGIGRALLWRLIALCEEGPWRQMIAVIGDSENHASIGLHRAEGFQMIGTHPAVGFKFGRWVDSVLMQRGLGPGARTRPTG
ncbi:MAG TPA: GNAT family N-acetyltransferase [Beijerinckiaceae bacterium]|jgi:L-amino acid N-acyltransferase YncA|nr:GNAT family N-acetyltransferase [Beijerinckiaceae bacterium]